MYIRSFRARNFLIHQDSRVILTPITVFVGPNGGGKSALFDAILNFSMVSRGQIRRAYGPYPFSFNAFRYRGAGDVGRMRFSVEMSRNPGDTEFLSYEIDYAQQGFSEQQPSFVIFNERLTKQPSNEVIFDRSDPDHYPLTQKVNLDNERSIFAAIRQQQIGSGSLGLDPLVDYCTKEISRFNKFRLDPNVLGQPSRLPEVASEPETALTPRIGHHGEDLAGTLYFLDATSDPCLQVIQDRIREVDPQFSRFEFNTVGTERIAFEAVYDDSRLSVNSGRLSSGMLLFIGLIVLVSTPNRPPVIMIEEPENGLTPQAIETFYQALRQLAFQNEPAKKSQILVSSHSPFVICEAWNGEDREFIHQVKIVDGKSRIRRFSEVVADQGIQLGKEKGERAHLSLSNAKEIMSGRHS